MQKDEKKKQVSKKTCVREGFKRVGKTVGLRDCLAGQIVSVNPFRYRFPHFHFLARFRFWSREKVASADDKRKRRK